MKNYFKFLVFLITVIQINNLMASENITGTWQGKLITGPGDEMNLQFNIKQEPNGSLSVILDSPDMDGIKNIRANSVDYASDNLKVEVAELNGFYEGVVKDGKIDGKWKQEGTSFPLNLSPYEKISKEVMEKLIGSWHGRPEMPELPEGFKVIRKKVKADVPEQGGDDDPIQEMTGTMGKPVQEGNNASIRKIVVPAGSPVPGEDVFPVHVFRFEISEKGNYTGSFAFEGDKSKPMKIIEISDSNIVCELPGIVPESRYKGKLIGNELVGGIYISIGGMINQMSSLTLTKGE